MTHRHKLISNNFTFFSHKAVYSIFCAKGAGGLFFKWGLFFSKGVVGRTGSESSCLFWGTAKLDEHQLDQFLLMMNWILHLKYLWVDFLLFYFPLKLVFLCMYILYGTVRANWVIVNYNWSNHFLFFFVNLNFCLVFCFLDVIF